MGSIRKRGEYWHVDLRINGRRIRQKVGKSKHLAELYLKDLELKAERNQLGFLDRKEIPIQEFVKEFLTYSQSNNRNSTTKRYKTALDNFLTFIQKETKISLLTELTPDVIEKFKTWRKNIPVSKNGDDPKKVKPAHVNKGAKSYTVNFEVMTLKTMFNLAVKWNYLGVSPSKGVKPLKTEDSKPRRFLSEGESRQLLESSTEECFPIFFAFLNTGMRRAELVNLEWKDVDFEQRLIHIRRKTFWIPKTGERQIPINTELLAVLNRLPKRGNFVFTDKRGNQMNADWIREQLVRTSGRAGIEKLTEVHALRHTFASQLNKQGVDLPSIQKLMGHNSIETTMIYTHHTTDQLRNAVNRLKLSSPSGKDVLIRIG